MNLILKMHELNFENARFFSITENNNQTDYKTIANIQTRLLQKVHVENRSQLILAAVRLNIVES